MRKLVLLAALLLLVSFAGAQQTSEALQNAGGSISGVSGNFKDSTNNALAKEINVPQALELPSRVIFGLPEREPVDMQTFIVLAGVWVILLLLLKSVLELVPIFNTNIKTWVGTIVITCLISMTGAVTESAAFFFGFGNFLGFLEEWHILKIIFSLLLLAIIFFALFRGIRIVKNKMALEEAVRTGYDIALERATARAARDVLKGKK